MNSYKITKDNGLVTMTDNTTGVTLEWMQDSPQTFRAVSMGTATAKQYMTIAQEMTAYAYENGLIEPVDNLAIEKQLVRKYVGDQLKAARESAGLTVRELAEKCGISYNHISRIEQGRYNVTIDTLGIIGKALGVEIRI